MGEPPGAGAERGRPNNSAPAGYRVCIFGLWLGGFVPERENLPCHVVIPDCAEPLGVLTLSMEMLLYERHEQKLTKVEV